MTLPVAQPKSVCPHCLAEDPPLGVKTMSGVIPLPATAHVGTAGAPALCLITLCGNCRRPWSVQWIFTGKTPFDRAAEIVI